MGYTTDFEGKFDLDKLPTAEVIVQLRALEGEDGREMDVNAPDAYCQWELTKDCLHIQWDGGEKFYKYVEWLQYIIDAILKPAGINLTGCVSYSGEETDDNGVLVIEDGTVKQVQNSELAATVDELQEFQRFVAEHSLGKKIMQDWKRRSR